MTLILLVLLLQLKVYSSKNIRDYVIFISTTVEILGFSFNTSGFSIVENKIMVVDVLFKEISNKYLIVRVYLRMFNY